MVPPPTRDASVSSYLYRLQPVLVTLSWNDVETTLQEFRDTGILIIQLINTSVINGIIYVLQVINDRTIIISYFGVNT